jgi:hypothetical protein
MESIFDREIEVQKKFMESNSVCKSSRRGESSRED